MKFVCSRKSSALLFKQRLGKTYIACGVIEDLRPRRVLIICPLTNRESTWRTKLHELVPGVPTHDTTGKGRKRLLAALQAFAEGVFLVHFEGCCSIIKQLCRREWDLIIVDEAHRAKDRSSLISRSLAKLRHSPARKLILTGTPIEEDPQDLWAQFRFVAVEVFGDRWKDFDQEFMRQPEIDLEKERKRGYVRFMRALMKQRILKKNLGFDFKKLPQFVSMIKDYCWREELPGPAPVFHIIRVSLLGYQRKVYEELDKRSVVTLRDGAKILTDIEIVKRSKLRQVTSGFLYDEEKNAHYIGCAKIRKLSVLLKKIKPPLPIFCLYREELRMLKELLTGRVATLSGETPRDERPKIQRAFQAGKLDWLLCQTKTGGVGIDLYRAKSLVVLSADYSSIDFDQLINRIRLPDQKEPVDIFLLIAEDTIDEQRQSMVFAKGRGVHKVLKQLRRQYE